MLPGTGLSVNAIKTGMDFSWMLCLGIFLDHEDFIQHPKKYQ
jgi:hypothetical protein